MWLFTRKQSIVRTARQPSDEVAGPDAPPSGRKPRLTTTRKALLEIAGISLFFGLSYGLMKGFFALSSDNRISMYKCNDGRMVFKGQMFIRPFTVVSVYLSCCNVCLHLTQLLFQMLDTISNLLTDKIGRASCRERECQYV